VTGLKKHYGVLFAGRKLKCVLLIV
jgi:hypothetical protein